MMDLSRCSLIDVVSMFIWFETIFDVMFERHLEQLVTLVSVISHSLGMWMWLWMTLANVDHLTVLTLTYTVLTLDGAVYDTLPNLATKHKICECSNSCRVLEGAECTC